MSEQKRGLTHEEIAMMIKHIGQSYGAVFGDIILKSDLDEYHTDQLFRESMAHIKAFLIKADATEFLNEESLAQIENEFVLEAGRQLGMVKPEERVLQ